jgi:hypothetical protein
VLPTEAEIAAWVRRRPIGAVIADICRDLGIVCGHPLWRELQRAITRERGNYFRLVSEIVDRGPGSLPQSGSPTRYRKRTLPPPARPGIMVTIDRSWNRKTRGSAAQC